MKRFIIMLFIIFFTLTFTSCNISFDSLFNPKTPNEKTEPITEEIVDPTVNPTKGEDNPTLEIPTENIPVDTNYEILKPNFTTRKINNKDEITMNDFFDLGNRVDIKVHINQEELEKIQQDYYTGMKSEIYRLASKVIIVLTNNNNSYKWEFENVGIRQKGNTSRNEIYNGDGNLNLNHYKLSFDETFNDPNMYDQAFIAKNGNELYSTREFLGMSGLDFKWNKNYDFTHIREIYTNYLYRSCGILAQNSGLSTFSLIETSKDDKETSMGLCTVYEPATKSFIKRSLKSDISYINMGNWDLEKAGTYGVDGAKYGDLYKCIYGADLTKNSISADKVGISNISGSYIPIYDRKTNKNAVYDDTLLKQAVNGISTGNYSTIEKYVDLEYLAISEAVGYFVGNPDSMRYNINNYMIYMRRTDGKMVFIPIDSDRCFGITKDWNPRDGHMNLTPLDTTDSNHNQTLNLLLKTILSKSNNESKTLYLKYIEMIAKSDWLTNECFNNFYNKAKESYSEEYFSLTDESINYSFSKYITNKLKAAGQVNSSNNTTGNNNNTGSTESYDNIYLVSTVNNWNGNDSQYKLVKIGECSYRVTFTVTKLEGDGNYIKFKFNNGYDYSIIDWSIDQDTGKLSLSGGSSYKYYDVKIGDILTVTINVNTLDVNIVKHQ